MPFLRFSRDKRGYEHTYLIHTSNKKGAQARILYWYRTPPGVKVGRPAFDPDVRKALEAQYPSITFEWSKLMDATPPPPDAEHWRDRRRQEKAARQARQAAERDDRRDEPAEPVDADPAPDALTVAASDIAADADVHAPDAPELDATVSPVASSPVASAGGDTTDAGARPRKRRRRGGRRRRKLGPGESAAPVVTGAIGAAQPDAGVETDADGDDESDDESPDVA